MQRYGNNYPVGDRFYRPLLEKMANTIDAKNTELELAKAKVDKLETDFAVREASKQPQMDNFKKAAETASDDLAKERDKFESDRNRITSEQAKLKNDLETARKKTAASLAEIEQKLKDANTQGARLKTINQALTIKERQAESTKFEVPSGEIRWINQRSGTAWINLGRADGLKRQFTFGVYPADITDIIAGRKGSIEVTKILGDHLAEAHVFDDKLLDPILPGDKIYTPVWIPGEKRHFALAGSFDIGGEGKDNVQYVKDIVTMNGGVVDCYLDENGKRVGDMTVNTRYLVLGDAPSEKGSSAVLNAFSNIQGDAERLGVQKIQLSDLLNRMGWKNQTSILHFGAGVGAKGLAPKPEYEQQQKSTGNISEVFQPRDPPARIPTSAF